MTHPDILKLERDGYLPQTQETDFLGRCAECGGPLYDNAAHVLSRDGLFCDTGCCELYYQIKHIE